MNDTMAKQYESRRRAEAREKAARIREVAQQHEAELARLREDMATVDAELKAAEQREAEVLVYANTQGLPPDVAEQKLDHLRGVVPQDALQMSREQWSAHQKANGFT